MQLVMIWDGVVTTAANGALCEHWAGNTGANDSRGEEVHINAEVEKYRQRRV
jgi:hypothetical protein